MKIEDIVNPELANSLKKKAEHRRNRMSDDKDNLESSENVLADGKLVDKKECLRKLPMKVCCPIDKVVLNTIRLQKHRRKVERMIQEVKKEIRSRKQRKETGPLNFKREFENGSLPTLAALMGEDSQVSLGEDFKECDIKKNDPDSEDYESDRTDTGENIKERSSSDDELVESEQKNLADMKVWLPGPSMPKMKKTKLKTSVYFPFKTAPKYEGQFRLGRGYSSLNLGRKNVITLLQKGIAVLLLHTGWEDTSSQAMDLLIYAAEQFYMKLVRLLRITENHILEDGNAGFSDSLEHVFCEMGLAGLRGVASYYRKRVLDYQQLLYKNCVSLIEEYKSLTQATQRDIISDLECKIEVDDADVPEIHLSALGEGYAVDELQPSLEPGFQMLHSLEQEEQLQNMEAEDEVTISGSPSQDSLHGSIRTKKKRKK